MSDAIVRYGEVGDLPKLTEIYNHYVEHTAVTFDIEPYTVERRKSAWFDKYNRDSLYRLWVVELENEVVGFATSGQFRERAAYASSFDTSVYLDHRYVGKGLGTLLYARLFEEMQKTGLHRAYAGITLPNDGSIALHQKFGFKELGTYNEVGHKFGRYHSVRWFEKAL